MDKKETLDALLSGKLNVKDVFGKFSTRELADWLTDYTRQLVAFAETKIVSLLNSSPPRSKNEGVFTGIFLRMFLWMKSLEKLNHSSHIQGVAVALRSQYELFLDLKLLSIDSGGECFEKYIAFSEIEMFKDATRRVRFYKSNSPKKRELQFLQEYISDKGRIDSIAENLKKYWAIDDIKDIGKVQHWSKKNVRERAIELGIAYEEIYIEFYSRLSSIVHGSGWEFFRKLNKEHYESYYSFCHQTAQRIFMEAVKIVASRMGIDKAWEHEGFYKQLKNVEDKNTWDFLLYKIEKLEEAEKGKDSK